MRTGLSLKELAPILGTAPTKAGQKADRAITEVRRRLRTDSTSTLAATVAAVESDNPEMLGFPWATIGAIGRANLRALLAMLAGVAIDTSRTIDSISSEAPSPSRRR